MKALLSYEPGGPETLKMASVPDPTPGSGQVLIRVAAVSLNYPDALMIEDLYQVRPPRPFAPGSEAAGVIVSVGEGVERFKAGDRVCALCGGGLAELALADASKAYQVPDDMPLDVASTLIITYGTNLHGLVDRVGLKAGETLLVLGAAGGVGTSAVELGKALGARVVGAVSSPEKEEVVRAAGAETVLVYPRGALDKAASRALADQFKAACPGGYDVIYDPVGGDYAEPALRSIAWEGRYAVIGFAAGIPRIPLNLPLLKACSLVGVYYGEWSARNPEPARQEMDQLFRLWSDGKIKPLISQRYPFERACDALALMKNRGAIGKLVVTI